MVCTCTVCSGMYMYSVRQYVLVHTMSQVSQEAVNGVLHGSGISPSSRVKNVSSSLSSIVPLRGVEK